MKTIFALVLSVIAFTVYGQNDEPHNYITAQPVVVYKYDFRNGVSIKHAMNAHSNLIFEKIGEVREDVNLNQVYVIQFRAIDTTRDDRKLDSNAINSSNTRSYEFYCIKATDFNSINIKTRYKKWYGKMNVAALVLPIKFRPRKSGIPLDYTNDFSLGSTVGYSFRISHFQPIYLSPVASLCVTSVNVDSTTTRGFITQPNTRLGAVTYGLGVMCEISGFQIGAVVGWDIIGGVTGSHWIYNNRNWFSVGIGYQFIQKNK